MQRSILISRDCPYESLAQLQDRCYGIVAIDFYAANQIFLTLLDPLSLEADEIDKTILFHVLLMLFCVQRQGSSCLHIASLDDAIMWQQQDLHGHALHSGYIFPSLETLNRVLNDFFTLVSDLESLIYEDGLLYTRRYYEYEKRIVNSIVQRLECQPSISESIDAEEQRLTLAWDPIFSEEDLASQSERSALLSPQKMAMLNACYRNFSIITGGAGTGKTYTIARLLLLLHSFKDLTPSDVLLLAPTGKAANRLFESINKELLKLTHLNIDNDVIGALQSIQPQTVHKVLRINPFTNKSPFNKGHQLKAKCVIVDECSMLDIATMGKLVDAIPTDCKLVLVGDPYQLPSINVGSLLAEFIRSFSSANNKQLNSLHHYLTVCAENSAKPISEDQCITTTLDRNYRADASLIELSQSILRKDITALMDHQSERFVINDIGETQDAEHLISHIITQWVAPRFQHILKCSDIAHAWHCLEQYAFLTPYRQGDFGVEAINGKIHATLHGSNNTDGFARGVPVMVEQNDYRLGLFNGDIGLLWPDKTGALKAWFKNPDSKLMSKNENYRDLSIHTLPRFSQSYAMTIHKTQGSEYQHVDILLPKRDEYLLSNELVYTAFTRAKGAVSVFTTKDILQAALHKNIRRASGLQQRFKVCEVLSSLQI
ncbi:MAG: exodeoxyribonuclease V subunit alpha [Pseudomonadota bacterium]